MQKKNYNNKYCRVIFVQKEYLFMDDGGGSYYM